LYFILFDQEKFSFKSDVINFGILGVLIILLFRTDDEIQNYLPVYILLFTLLANLALIYSISTNPNYILGTRATVQFNSQSSGEFSGNPQIYGRNGVIGMIISLLLMIKKQKFLFLGQSKIITLVSHINFIVSFVVLVLTQTRGNLISIVIILFFFFFVKKTDKETYIEYSHKNLVRTYYILFISGLVYLNNSFQLFDKITSYYDQIIYVVNRAVSTGVTLGKGGDNDPSAMGRVNSIEFVQKEFLYKPYNFIIGNGFKYHYLDIPILETWLNFGIVGFLLFFSFNVAILYNMLRALRSPSIFQNFIALFYLNVFVTIFTSGRPVDTIYWIFYLILIRFLNVSYNPKP
jgi:O-antigen ligase